MNIDFARQLIKKMELDYDRIADHFSETRSAPWPEFTMLEELVRPGQRVCDVGCGNGRLAEMIKKIKADYTGLDLSAKLIAQAKTLYPQAEFVRGSMLNLPFTAGSFDVIVAVASLQHVPSTALRQQAAAEMARVAKPGARLFLVNWNLFQTALPNYFTAAKQEFGDQWEIGDALIPWKNKSGAIVANRYYHGFSEKELAALLTAAGWEMQDQYYMTRTQRTNKQTGFNLVTIASLPA